MKKVILLTVIAVFGVAAMAQASTISFSWGALFNQFSNSEISSSNGNGASINWYADDFGCGFRTETNTLSGDGNLSDTLTVNEITVDKWISKAVFIGLGIGSGTITSNNLFDDSNNDVTSGVLDVRGGIQLLAGKGEKVNASLDFLVDARFMTTPGLIFDSGNNCPNLNGTLLSLAVTLGL